MPGVSITCHLMATGHQQKTNQRTIGRLSHELDTCELRGLSDDRLIASQSERKSPKKARDMIMCPCVDFV
jgi:hypothetical protein